MKVGIQLYSVRNSMAMDPVGTMRRVAELGYRSIEIANHGALKDTGAGFGMPAAELKALLASFGAAIVSSHVSPINDENVDEILAYQRELGVKYLSSPVHFFPDRQSTVDAAKRLNDIGKKCRDYGIHFLYHNHFLEFQMYDGQTVYDIVMENSDPEYVGIQLDTYWAMRGRQDPIELMKRYGKRIRIIHQKDYPAGHEAELDLLTAYEAQEPYIASLREQGLSMPEIERNVMAVVLKDLEHSSFTEIGTGTMDIQSILDAAAAHCGCDYVILEQDYTALDEIESVKLSMEQFKKYRGIEWD